jgi:hypothetical protein
VQTIDPQGFIDYEEYGFEGNSGTVLNKSKFLEGLRLKASVYHAAQYAGVGRTTVYRWLDQDPVFAQAVADATEDAGDKMETSVYERAFNDNLLAMFWLKAHRHKFRDKTVIDINVVQNEINERMQGLGLKQLPPMIPELTESAIDTACSQSTEDAHRHAIPAPSSQSAKRDE